ncbi:hypothetical protein BCR32DRAFT_282519 [Anaeromyces robustus]|uniref:Uncharacterized protein n=1 Tax=Anaeromyces robustus TaxID=1754192 RepID=A0A1Y1WYC2_9FUNG|nr:hypothetical protein BCR32DRAFT_282519 [Anaeromyces robustus]|eukprot:ORX78196.1 hypothetical protein BCR32DRAFT_282519 [Anaeromyces robustus]
MNEYSLINYSKYYNINLIVNKEEINNTLNEKAYVHKLLVTILMKTDDNGLYPFLLTTYNNNIQITLLLIEHINNHNKILEIKEKNNYFLFFSSKNLSTIIGYKKNNKEVIDTFINYVNEKRLSFIDIVRVYYLIDHSYKNDRLLHYIIQNTH